MKSKEQTLVFWDLWHCLISFNHCWHFWYKLAQTQTEIEKQTQTQCFTSLMELCPSKWPSICPTHERSSGQLELGAVNDFRFTSWITVFWHTFNQKLGIASREIFSHKKLQWFTILTLCRRINIMIVWTITLYL